MIRTVAALLAVAVSPLATGTAAADDAASERIAVAILPVPGERPGMADDLTEVAIAELAKAANRDLLGGPELRSWLASVEHGSTTLGCMEEPGCRGRLGAELGLKLFVVGTITPAGGKLSLQLALVELPSGQIKLKAARTVEGDPATLIGAVQDAARQVGRAIVQTASVAPSNASEAAPAPSRATPPPSAIPSTVPLAIPSPTPPVAAPSAALTLNAEPRSTRTVHTAKKWAEYTAVGSLGLGLLCLGTGSVFGRLAEQPPTGNTRLEAQMDAALRRNYATTANTLFIVSGTLAAVSAIAFARYLTDSSSD